MREKPKQLRQLQQLERVTFTNISYEKVEIEKNSVIYCDPPYANTSSYDDEFSHNQFIEWAHSQSNPVYISEYEIKDKRFIPVFRIQKRSRLNMAKSLLYKQEIVYGNKPAVELIRSRKKK